MEEIGFLFDLDGVLIDSEREYTRIWNEIEKTFPTGKRDFALSIKGQTLSKILKDNYPDEIREKVSDLLHRLEKEMVYSYCAHAEDFLNHLKKKGIKIAVVTSSDEVKMAHLFKDIPEFQNKVDVIIDASKVTRSKPDPEGYLRAAKELGVDIYNCIVFEDSVQGVKAGCFSGAFTVGMEGTKPRAELEPYTDLVVSSFADIDIDELIEMVK